MLTLSKPISAGQAQAYHKSEFANAKENYYTEGERVRGEWQGQLAARYGLRGEVNEEQFARLSEGQHPQTGEALIRCQQAHEYVNEHGETVRAMEHRAGWDATFSAPKSVALTALVGGDNRVREAHRKSVRVALDEMEKYAQARIGGNAPAQTTGAWAVAKFEHDSSRPVNGYAAPQLHTHAVIFNVTETAEGKTRSLQAQELYKTQQFATAVYRSELAARLQSLGYEVERGAHGQPEIKGYTREYMEASSPRRQQIVERLEEQGRRGAGAAQIAAHRTRDAKQALSVEEVRAQHQRLAQEHGNQPQRVMAEASRRWGVELEPECSRRIADNAVSYARERGMERLAGNDQQVILSDRLWRSQFGADPNIVGRAITLNDLPFVVTGIMPAGTQHPGNNYRTVSYGEGVDIWWPFTFEGDPSHRGSHFIEGIGRLKPGVTMAQANSELNAIMTELSHAYPDNDTGWSVRAISLESEVVGASREMLLVLLGAVGMVLLIACANAANLLLARATTRRRELAVRLALGAQRARLVRQLLTESLVIAFLGGALGVAMAFGGVKALVALLPTGFPRAHEIHVSLPVLAFTFVITTMAGILFGLVPAIHSSRTDPGQGLHEGGRSATNSGRVGRLRNSLVIAEVSLARVLMIGAGLMMRSLLNLLHLDPGFREQHVLTASMDLPNVAYKTPAAVAHFYEELTANLSSLPGVESVGAGSDLPWTGYDENLSGFTIEGKQPPPHQDFHGRYHVATAGYFQALGIPLVSGRFFNDGDKAGAPSVVIINHAMAEKYWGKENPVGRRIDFFEDHPKEKDWFTVIGVVGDVKDRPDSPGAQPAFWWSNLQPAWANPEMSLVIRANGDPEVVAAAMRDAVKRLDPALAVADVREMDQIVQGSVTTPRFAFVLVGLFAGLAVLLASIGVHGVIAYWVSQRTPEFGLRMAMGAQRSDVLRLVLGQAATLVLTGTACGMVLALMLGHVLKSMIYEVSPTDPLTLAAVGGMVIAVAFCACYLPARRATRVDPMIALRAE